MRLKAYIDGSCFGNPGEAGYAVVVFSEAGERLRAVGRYIGRSTNNVAEYSGLLACLDIAAEMGAKSLTVRTDSELMVRQILGIYKVKTPHLAVLHKQARERIKAGKLDFRIIHVPREENNEADGLARRAVRMKREVIE
jgi:ribonuclease HI